MSGFNLRRYLSGGARGSGTASRSASSAATATQRLVPVLESVMKLVDAGLLDVAFTEWVTPVGGGACVGGVRVGGGIWLCVVVCVCTT